jgi:hypothetical protein
LEPTVERLSSRFQRTSRLGVLGLPVEVETVIAVIAVAGVTVEVVAKAVDEEVVSAAVVAKVVVSLRAKAGVVAGASVGPSDRLGGKSRRPPGKHSRKKLPQLLPAPKAPPRGSWVPSGILSWVRSNA